MTLDVNCFLPKGASHTSRVMVEAALKAGDVLQDAAAQRDQLNITEKSAGDFVSDADHRAEAVIFSHLSTAYPDYGWLGEESGTRPGIDGAPHWVVDPLDGTTNFLKGIPHWAVSIALCQGETVTHAVVYDPAKSESFTAERGRGAFLNGTPISVSQDVAMPSALFATGVPSGGRVTYLPNCLKELDRLMPRCAGIRRAGAAALDLAYVAAGRLEGYWERNLGAWDIAAGVLLVEEAGGQVSPMWKGSSYLSTGSFIASNAELAEPLAATLDRTPPA